MRLAWLATLMIVPLLGACGDDGDDKTDTAQDTAADTSVDTAAPDTTADTVVPDTTADTAVPDTTADTSPETIEETTAETIEEVAEEVTPDKVTWDDVYPIFRGSCVPCHASGTATAGSGGHSIASADKAVAYQASQLRADIAKCDGKTIGECALIRIRDGSMPATGDCQDPKTDDCPDAAEQTLIQRWIDDGMLEQ